MDALASFRYNIGNLDQLTAGGTRTTDQIAEYLPKYNKAGGKVSEGLINRRQAELDIFNRNREQSEVPPTEAPPHAQETVVAETPVPVPGGDEPPGGSFFGGGDLANLATSFWQPQAPIPIQGQQLQQVNPEYIPSVASRGDRRRNRNEGGPVEYLNVGGLSRRGRRRKEKGGPATAEQLGPNYTSAYSGGGRNAPRGPLQPKGPEQDRTINPLPPGRDPDINRFNQELGRLGGQAQLKVGPQGSGQVPAIDDLPPVPATDEALLQNSSQAVEEEETNKLDAAKIMQEIQKLSPDEQEAALNALSPEMQEAVLEVETQAYQTQEAAQGIQQPAQWDSPIPAVVPEPPALPAPPTSNAGTRRTEAGGPATVEQLGPDYATSYDPGQQRAADRPREFTPPPQETNPIVSVDPYTGETTFADGQTIVDPTQEQIAAVTGRPDVPTGSLPASRGRNEPRSQAGGGRPDVPVGSLPGSELPVEEPKKEMSQNEKNAAATTIVEDTLAKNGETPGETLDKASPDSVANSGQAQLDANPNAGNKIKSQIKGAFGDLIDGQELARMAVLFLGARATGASPGQALAYAGQQYLGRLDAKANRFDQLATSGKYTKQSLQEYKKTGDITSLLPVGVAPERTGNFVTKWTKNGPVQLEEVKVGDNTLLQDANGNIRSGFEFKDDESSIHGSPAWKDRVKQSVGGVKEQLTELRDAFDVFETETGKGSKTDILPATNATKVAEFAADNDIHADQLGGLIESAVHNAINDAGPGKPRARNLVPYLRQLAVRQIVPGNAEVFHAKEQPKDKSGPPNYVSTEKLQILNQAAANKLKSLGHRGGVQDLSNMLYTETLKDWNQLDADTKKQWDRKALGDESGYYLFTQDLLLKGAIF